MGRNALLVTPDQDTSKRSCYELVVASESEQPVISISAFIQSIGENPMLLIFEMAESMPPPSRISAEIVGIDSLNSSEVTAEALSTGCPRDLEHQVGLMTDRPTESNTGNSEGRESLVFQRRKDDGSNFAQKDSRSLHSEADTSSFNSTTSTASSA